MKDKKQVEAFRQRLAVVVEVGASDDAVSRGYDFMITLAILINLLGAILQTFSDVDARWGRALDGVDQITAALFALDYLLRLISAKYIYPRPTELESLKKYVLSFTGLVDLFSFLPVYLPVFFPAGTVAFRIFRIIRIFRLFRINAYYDSLNAITEVIASKRQQLVSSVFIIVVLLLAASLCMYSVEHEAQPDVFVNAFSGIWWAVSTLLTVGYGDIYPVTALGKTLSIVITFLGVGMVAIPTGIISAGFVEQYNRMQDSERLAREVELQFIRVPLHQGDNWIGRQVMELLLPRGIILAAVHRGREVIIPRGDVCLEENDVVVLGAEPLAAEAFINLKEITLRHENPWNGCRIRDLDISRQSLILMVRRKGKMLIPNGNTTLMEGDTVLLHTKHKK